MPRKKITGKVGRVRRAMKVCADLIDAVPRRDDNIVQKVVKVVSIAEIILTHVEGEESAIEAFASRLGLTKKNSPQFVNLFFSTPIKDVFEQNHIQLNEHCQITKAVSERLDGALYFVERNYGFGINRDNDFYFEGDFKFSKVLQQLWDHFDNRINVRIGRGLSGKADLEYTTFPISKDEVYGKAQKMVDTFVAKHRLMQVDDVSRTYLFVGSPGLGKSTQALRIASQVGKRILRLDANSLVEFQANEMAFLLGGLQPDVLVVDDVDKAGIKGDHYSHDEKQPASLLSIMEWIKNDHPEIVFLMTANSIEGLPEAMLRPGRIDSLVWFDKPNKTERRAILKGYLGALVPEAKRPTANGLEVLVTKTDGLGPAWLREVALQCRYQTQAEVLKIITGMKRLGAPERTRRRTRRISRRRKKPAVVTITKNGGVEVSKP